MKRTLIMIFLLAISVMATTGMADQKEGLLYVKVNSENLLDAPKGKKLGTLAQGTQLTVLETKGNWVKVSVEGWIWQTSTTDDPSLIAKAAAAHKGVQPLSL